MRAPRLVIAGTHSGVGKTTVAVGLMAALAHRGFPVAPFKVGPDYLDPGFHAAACGRPSGTLDSWMLGEHGVRESFARGMASAGSEGGAPPIAVIEGMMGLHDGADANTDRGSTAEIARLLQAPVVLILDASALARSAGAVALGYRSFDERVPVAGVIANRVAGEGHAAYLRPAIEEIAGLPFLGWLPTESDLSFPERHLGLVGTGEQSDLADRIGRWRALVEERLDVDRLLELAASAPPLPEVAQTPMGNSAGRVRIAVARDEAFQFYYPDNLALLEAAGAELIPFSPLRDTALPDSVGGVYLGGGYPELHASQLAGNNAMRRAIREAAGRGLPIYAECGGFMLLCEALVDVDGRLHPMVGLVPGRCVMERSLHAIGYREAVGAGDNLLGPAGTVIRGHEFHHSRFEGELPSGSEAFHVGDRPVGFARGSLLASYVHLHFGSNPGAAEHFVRRCLPQS